MGAVSDIVTGILGGGGDAVKNNSVVTSNQGGTVTTGTDTTDTKKSTTQTGTVQSSTQNSTQNTSGTVQALSGSAIQGGEDVIAALTKNFSSADLGALVTRIKGTNDASAKASVDLLNRAQGAQASLDSGTDAIVENAQRQGNQALTAQASKASAGAGSAFNSLVAQVYARGEGDLQTSLAALKSQISTQNRQQATNELIGAIGALNQTASTTASSETGVALAEGQINALNAGAVSSAITAIKGGLTSTDLTTTGTVTGRTESQQTQNTSTRDIINSTENKTVDLNTTQATVGNVDTTKQIGILNVLDTLAKFKETS